MPIGSPSFIPVNIYENPDPDDPSAILFCIPFNCKSMYIKYAEDNNDATVEKMDIPFATLTPLFFDNTSFGTYFKININKSKNNISKINIVFIVLILPIFKFEIGILNES